MIRYKILSWYDLPPTLQKSYPKSLYQTDDFLIDTETNECVFSDPSAEDATLRRDLSDLVLIMNNLAEELKCK